MGPRERYVYAVRSPVSRSVRTSRPLTTPRSPPGTVRRKVKSALSEGWSLQGKTVCAESADADGASVQAERVEGEAGQGLGGADRQGRGGLDEPGRGVVREVEMVGRDAVAVVAEGGENGVAEGLGAREASGRPGFFEVAAWAGTPAARAAAVPIRAAAGAVTLVRYLMVRSRSDGRVVRSGRAME